MSKIGGWSASQVRAWVKNFVRHHTAKAWFMLGPTARKGLVDSEVVEHVLSLDRCRSDDGGVIVIDDIRQLREAIVAELAAHGWGLE